MANKLPPKPEYDYDSIDDWKLLAKKDSFNRISCLTETNTVTCAFIGGACNKAYDIEIPILADRAAITSHLDLDVFLWMPGCPFRYTAMTSTSNKFRSEILWVPGNGMDDFKFVFIHYDQDIMKLASASQNWLIKTLTDTRHEWYGEVIVVKTSMDSGRVVDMEPSDFSLLPGLLRGWLDAPIPIRVPGTLDEWLGLP